MPTPALNFDISRIPSLLNRDEERIRLAKERQCALWERRPLDKAPCLLRAPLTPEQQVIPGFNLKEGFYDPEKMLCSQVRQACGVFNAGADGVPSIRVNSGTGTLLSCFGLEQEVFEDKMPWLKTHLTKERAAKLTPDDIQIKGTFARGLEYMKFFKKMLGDALPVYCMDTQGPFDLAHLLLGDALFYELYDDPPFVHHVMELCLELGIRAHTLMKEINGEPPGAHYHSNEIYAGNMGIRICEDTTALVGPDVIDEFAMPYTKRLAARFGGAWMHYCGRCDHLTDAACAMPEIRMINFGHIPNRQFEHSFEEDMERCAATGTVYKGDWPRYPDESGPAYLQRLHTWASRGRLLPYIHEAIEPGGEIPDHQAVIDCWHSL